MNSSVYRACCTRAQQPANQRTTKIWPRSCQGVMPVHLILLLIHLPPSCMRKVLPRYRRTVLLPDRETYLRRPDLGRQLATESRNGWKQHTQPIIELVIVIGDIIVHRNTS